MHRFWSKNNKPNNARARVQLLFNNERIASRAARTRVSRRKVFIRTGGRRGESAWCEPFRRRYSVHAVDSIIPRDRENRSGRADRVVQHWISRRNHNYDY